MICCSCSGDSIYRKYPFTQKRLFNLDGAIRMVHKQASSFGMINIEFVVRSCASGCDCTNIL